MEMIQRTIFDEIRLHEIMLAYPIIHQKAQELLAVGLSEKWKIEGYAVTDSNYFVICAKHKDEYLFNVLDAGGNVPENPCWRTFANVKRELKLNT